MKLGELAEVIIQPQYGFGSEEHQLPQATIPANSTLFYTLQLVELNKVPSCAVALLCYSLFFPQFVYTQDPSLFYTVELWELKCAFMRS